MNEELYAIINTRYKREGKPYYFIDGTTLMFTNDINKATICDRTFAEKIIDAIDSAKPITNSVATEYDIIPINKTQA